MAATLGDIRWGVQYSSVEPAGQSGGTKTLNGLNLDESAGAEAESVNAEKAYGLVSALMRLSLNTLTTASLIETRGIEYDG